MIYKIGLTGGIGSGKSLSAHYFAELGVPIIDADAMSRKLVAPGQPALTKIIERFGSTLIQENGELNRLALREIIFNDPKHKHWLEKLLHPLIKDAILDEIHHIHAPYCIIVIPLLAETHAAYQNLLDHIIVIDVSEAEQLSRASMRDKTTQRLVQKIISSQASRQKRLSIADTIIENNATTDDLKNKIKNLHKSFLKALS